MGNRQTAAAQMSTMIRRYAGMAVGLAVLAGVGMAEQSIKLPSADDILERNVQALGGENARLAAKCACEARAPAWSTSSPTATA